MRSTLLVLALLPLPVLSCSDSDGPADDPALPAATERVLLTDQSTWTSVAAAGDPFGAPDPGEEVCDDPSELMAEVEFSGFWHTVVTRHCSYATARTVLKEDIPRGASVRARFFHFTVNKAGAGSWRVAVAVGDTNEIVVDKTYPLPAKTALFDEEFIAARSYKKGEAVHWHVDNHGINDWSILEISALGPLESCPLADADCSAHKNCEWYGQCALDVATCRCVANDADACRASTLCTYYGLCGVGDTGCTAVDTADCNAATHCELDGFCTLDQGECCAVTDDDCKDTDLCKNSGMCTAQGCGCVAKDDDACRNAQSCRYGGQCTEKNGACCALTQEDCGLSEECAGKTCKIEDCFCVPE